MKNGNLLVRDYGVIYMQLLSYISILFILYSMQILIVIVVTIGWRWKLLWIQSGGS